LRQPGVLQHAALLALAGAFGILAGFDPKYAVAGAIGLAFSGAVLVNLTFGVCLFTLVAFVDVLPDFGGAFFSFAKIVGALLAASWAATVAVRRRRRTGFVSAHPFAAYALALFIAWGAASMLWAEQPSEGASALPRYALNLVLFIIVYAAVSERRHAVWVASAYVAGATVAGTFAVLGLGPSFGNPTEIARATGTVGDANELAALLIPGLVLALVLGAVAKNAPLGRLAAFTAAGICIVGLFLTLSRGGLVGLGCALVAGIVVGGRWRPAAALAALAIALTTVGYFSLVASPEQRQRVTTVEGGTGRTDIWTVGMRMVRAHPVEGVGLGNFKNSSVHYLLEPGALTRSDLIVDRPRVAHNTFLQVLSELGIPGLVLFLAIVGFSLRAAFLAARLFDARGDLRMELLARGLLVSLIGLLAADFFLSANFSKQLWLLLGVCPALEVIARGEGLGEPTAKQKPRGRRRWSQAPSLQATPEAVQHGFDA
jgi:O-antigen ligase